MLAYALVIALIVLFFWKCFQRGMIFGKVGDWAEKNFPGWLYTATVECPVCMSVWIGGAVYLVGYLSGVIVCGGILEAVFTIMAAGGINTIFVESVND